PINGPDRETIPQRDDGGALRGRPRAQPGLHGYTPDSPTSGPRCGPSRLCRGVPGRMPPGRSAQEVGSAPLPLPPSPSWTRLCDDTRKGAGEPDAFRDSLRLFDQPLSRLPKPLEHTGLGNQHRVLRETQFGGNVGGGPAVADGGLEGAPGRGLE